HTGDRAAGDGDRITGNRPLVVPLGVVGSQVHAAVADVDEPLLPDRPGGGVVVVAAPGEPDRPEHRDVLVAGPAHQDRVALLDGQVGAVGSVVTRHAARVRPGRVQLALPVDPRLVRHGARYADQRVADPERIAQVGGPVHTGGDREPVEVRREAHLGVLRPVALGAEAHGLVAVPDPGAHDRLGGLDL